MVPNAYDNGSRFWGLMLTESRPSDLDLSWSLTSLAIVPLQAQAVAELYKDVV